MLTTTAPQPAEPRVTPQAPLPTRNAQNSWKSDCMNTARKSSIEEIRDRFDRDVDRFSNLETGQTATIDAALVLDLIARSAAAATPAARAMLDIGCGAGNFTLKLLERLP